MLRSIACVNACFWRSLALSCPAQDLVPLIDIEAITGSIGIGGKNTTIEDAFRNTGKSDL